MKLRELATILKKSEFTRYSICIPTTSFDENNIDNPITYSRFTKLKELEDLKNLIDSKYGDRTVIEFAAFACLDEMEYVIVLF